MECRDAQFYLRLQRHATDELGPDVTAPLTDHLAACAACAADAGAVASFDRALAAAMVAVAVPSGLRAQLVSHVATKQGAILRQKMYKTGGFVVAAMLLVGIGLGVFSNTRPAVDIPAMLDKADQTISDPERATQEWLVAQKLPDRLPLPFDYSLFVSHGYDRVHGEYVPMVLFRAPDGPGFAKVYVFRHDGMLDLKQLQDTGKSFTIAEVIPKEFGVKKYTYVVIHTGGPDGMKQFYHTRKGGSS